MDAAAWNDLDDHAKRELADERTRHVAVLNALFLGDTAGFLWEFNQHMDRVNEIMRGFVHRRSEST